MAALALGLAAPAQAHAPSPALPELGDPAAASLAPAAERRLGESIMRRLRRDPVWLDDAEVVDYLQQVAAPLQALPQVSGWTFEWFAMDAGSINAMALPGGFIGVHLGVLMAAESESELASVLAHEMSHVMLRHSARIMGEQKQASVAMAASLVLAALAARSNPQAAWGSAMLGSQMAQSSVLAFSREAEREADRLGLALLRDAGFEPQAMVRFFGRLQHAQRFQSSQAPAYWQTHPLTTERMADIALRVPQAAAAPRADTREFALLRARLRASADESVAARTRERALAEAQVRAHPESDAPVWFGLASIAAAQGDTARAREALTQAERQAGAGHPYLAALAVQLQLRDQDPLGAAQRAAQALATWPQARALARLEVQAWLAADQPSTARDRARAHLKTWPKDSQLWLAQATAHHRLGQRARAHQATAEAYWLLGSAASAQEQLRLAQAAGDADFVTASVIDARLRALEPEAQQERREAGF